MYTKQVLEHFQNPHNQGQIADPSAVGQVGNPVCGDIMKLYLQIKPAESGELAEFIIEDVKFETLGCGAAIATSSVLTDLVKGQTIAFAEGLTKQNIIDELGELPKPKIHCSLLAVDALHKAIEDYKSRK
jgi:nitrogen fixation NifU-like protein